jgi:hypothetical protein
LDNVWLFPLAETAQSIDNDFRLGIELRSVSKMGEIAATTTLKDIWTHGLDTTRRRFEHLNDSTVFASFSFDDRNFKSFAGKSTIDKDDSSVLTA